ncbi:C45 family autoproteolytic acyltransferase/hydolase [Flagellimonas flava]|uniref:C45 family autoproteolytic acyltransferase/hydolase n=1 Tax=Flagellimonas flava TaxID=570519 RepID=UPI0013F4DE1C|nr:C45 family peptidase [Allomuricauda flava]
MRNSLFAVLILVFIGCSPKKDPKKQEHSFQSIYYIEQDSDAYANGKHHGSALKEEVILQVNEWHKGITDALNIDQDSMHNIVHKHTGFVKAIEKYAPELLEEINGIADGAGLDRDLVLLFNLGEEIYNFCTSNYESCSNMAYRGTDKNILVYNQDLPKFLHGSGQPILLRHRDHFVFTMPGSIALSGVSENLAVSCNSLPMLNMNIEGLPLVFVVRKLLQMESISEARHFIEHIPMAIAQNLMLVSGEEVVNLEISKNEVNVHTAKMDSVYYHTNFPIQNSDYKTAGYQHRTCNRYLFLDSLDMAAKSPEDLSKLFEKAFATRPIKNDETYLQFLVTYQKESKPILQFINPRTNESVSLTF